ncbi:MAG: hypothetical protein WB729_16695 [Candidatus Sulfotelmatobacter sp.]
MKLSLLALGQEGYYQRLVLDQWQRIGLRLFGAVLSFFGMALFFGALASLLRVNILSVLAETLFVEMGLLFVAAWVLGLILAVVQAIRGQFFDWYRMWKQARTLGPINVYPTKTPAMEREARVFSAAFCLLVGVAVCATAYRR